jgi:hypothetical protein
MNAEDYLIARISMIEKSGTSFAFSSLALF